MLKSDILHIIYQQYEQWAGRFAVACRPACSTCCTQNVTISAIEGEEILNYALGKGLATWLGQTLATTEQTTPPPMTTNQFAAACLAGRETSSDWPANQTPCPFLTDNLCQIYAARPFACRLFLSTRRCQAGDKAEMPTAYPGVASAICQVIEHLSQRRHWGNMNDVLLALLTRPAYQEIAHHVAPDKITTAQTRLLTAQPLPGFLLDEEESRLTSPLLNSIFASEVDGKTIGAILGA